MGGTWEPTFQNSPVHGEVQAAPSPFSSPERTWNAKDPEAPYVAAPLAAGWEPVGAGSPIPSDTWAQMPVSTGAPPRRSRLLALEVVLLVLAVAAAAAVPFVLKKTPAASVDTALTSTFSDASVQMTITLTVQSTAPGQAGTVTGSARADEATKTYAVTLSLHQATAPPQTVHLIVEGTAFYLSDSEISLPTGKPWIGLTEAKLRAELPPTSLPSVPVTTAPGPTGTWVSVLEKSGATVTTVPDFKTKSGLSEEGYMIAITPSALASLISSFGIPGVNSESIASSGLQTIDLDVGVGTTGRVNELDLAYQDDTAGAPVSVHATVALSHYGTPVTIPVPPATQTATFFAALGPLTQSPVGQLLSAG